MWLGQAKASTLELSLGLLCGRYGARHLSCPILPVTQYEQEARLTVICAQTQQLGNEMQRIEAVPSPAQQPWCCVYTSVVCAR